MHIKDGPMARRIFRDPELLSRTTNVPINMITGMWDLHIALASTLPLCPVKMRKFTLEYKAEWSRDIDFYPISPAVGQVIDHFHQARTSE